MSELKDLAWAVQEIVEPVPFEQLERRGVLRRRRRQAVVGAGVVAATVIAILAAVLPFGGKVGTEPAPVASMPGPTDPRTAAVLGAADAQVRSMTMLTPDRWASSWVSCEPAPCRYAAVLSRDGVRAFAPMRHAPYAMLQRGDELVAVVGPEGTNFEENKGLSWRDANVVRLTAAGTEAWPLRWAKPSATFAADEILTDQIGPSGQTLVLNLENRTLRKLVLEGQRYGHSPVRDSTGRLWLVTGESGEAADSWVAWTDDGGKTWDQTLLDPDKAAARIAVSPDGRTIVAGSLGDGTSASSALKLSTDRGASWQPDRDNLAGPVGGPAAFDDGTALLLAQRPDVSGLALFVLGAGGAQQLDSRPDRLEDLAGGGGLVYGVQAEVPLARKVAFSTDQGRTWKAFEPR